MKRWFEIKNAADRVAEIYIYDIIGQNWDGSGVSAKQFVEDLVGLKDATTIRLYINSPGGLVHEGMAIYSALLRHPARKEVFVDGMAASSAATVAMVGDEIAIGDNALFMIHDPYGCVCGGVEEMQRAMDMLTAAKESIINVYESRTKLDREKISEMMKAETWMTAKDAVDMGFATSITKPFKIAAHWNPSLLNFKNAPSNLGDLVGEKKSAEAQKQPSAVFSLNDLRRKHLELAEAETMFGALV